MQGSYTIFILVAFVAIFYFLMIRPQQKQRKAHQAMLSALKKGDHVMTAAGVYGKVRRVEESLVELEIARGVNIKIARNAVQQVIRDKKQARAVAPGPRGKRGREEIEDPLPEIEETTSEAVEVEEEVEAEEVYEEEAVEDDEQESDEDSYEDEEEYEEYEEAEGEDEEEADVEDDVEDEGQQRKRRKRRR